jgi:DNA-binding response OmpR family regulator
MRILVVDDDNKTATFVSKALKAKGCTVDVLRDGDEALQAILASSFDAVVLDIMLAGRDGLSVLRQLRAQGNHTPVLLLSARGEVNERVEGLTAGADDYLPKPFALAELLARVGILARRGGQTKPAILRLADLVLDTAARTARRGGRKIELTTREFRLLEYLMSSAGRICTRMMIYEQVWEYHFDPGSNLVDVYVRKLREKIDAGGVVKLLHSVRGEGYVMKETA